MSLMGIKLAASGSMQNWVEKTQGSEWMISWWEASPQAMTHQRTTNQRQVGEAPPYPELYKRR